MDVRSAYFPRSSITRMPNSYVASTSGATSISRPEAENNTSGGKALAIFSNLNFEPSGSWNG
ncbi:hypothetical protein DPMN_139912 [Dreissena polymorpha]|uniref:Uncharacterized protein n=1 Tax=Dreissena polymorpha TaxID=45954 RepID=A0A9D4GCJ0_DREPO|nr:hypothetical protein DPMN_139912 [Dreissena polymorpha]